MSTDAREKGLITSSILQIARLVSESAAFQTRVGAATAAEALPKVHLFEIDDTDPEALTEARPFALVWPADAFDMQCIAGGGNSLFKGHMQVVLVLSDNDRVAGDRAASALDFAGWIDAVVLDIVSAAGVDDRATIHEIRFMLAPSRTPTKDEPTSGAYWDVAFLLTVS
jgi:hypothetical protein